LTINSPKSPAGRGARTLLGASRSEAEGRGFSFPRQAMLISRPRMAAKRVVRHGPSGREREVLNRLSALSRFRPATCGANRAGCGWRSPAAFALRRPDSLPPLPCGASKSIETLLPILYLKGISTGDFPSEAALAALLGKDRAGAVANSDRPPSRTVGSTRYEGLATERRDLFGRNATSTFLGRTASTPCKARLGRREAVAFLVLIGGDGPEGRPRNSSASPNGATGKRAGLA